VIWWELRRMLRARAGGRPPGGCSVAEEWRHRRDEAVFYAGAGALCAVVLWYQLRCLGVVDPWVAARLAR